MQEANFSAIANDVNNLLKDAQAVFQAAATAGGDKADEMHKRGMVLIDTAMTRAQNLQSFVISSGKEAKLSADDYVKSNPWRVIATAGGLGLLVGLIVGNK